MPRVFGHYVASRLLVLVGWCLSLTARRPKVQYPASVVARTLRSWLRTPFGIDQNQSSPTAVSRRKNHLVMEGVSTGSRQASDTISGRVLLHLGLGANSVGAPSSYVVRMLHDRILGTIDDLDWITKVAPPDVIADRALHRGVR